MASIDKVTRILMMYSRLLEGGKIYKKTFRADMEINRRTFDRDIEDIRLFLSEAYVGYDLVYDRKDEYAQLITNVSRTGVWNKQEMFTKISLKDIETYSDQGKGEALLKMQWDLQQCINERDVIKLLLPDKEKKVVLPLALWIADGELYLIGYGMTKKLEAVPVREIESFRMEQKKFSREIAEQFKIRIGRK